MRRWMVVLWWAVLVAVTGFSQDLTELVVVDEGVRLATDVYLPHDRPGPWPAVLIRTPYGRKSAARDCTVYKSAGLACVSQDLRSFGGSGGEFAIFATDRDDGQATIAWIVRQAWSDGKVATAGGSVMGATQYLLAPGAPAGLRAIAPRAAHSDVYHQAVFWGGALRQQLVFGWLAALGLPKVTPKRLLDASWDSVRPLRHADQITVPGLHIGGWYDLFVQGTLDGFTVLQTSGGDGARGRQKLIVGPWAHGALGSSRTVGRLKYPQNALKNWRPVDLAWQVHWLRQAGEVDAWPTAQVYLMGAAESPDLGIPAEPDAPGNEWLNLDAWPPAATTQSLLLTADGGLGRTAAKAGELILVIDPDDPVPTLGGTNPAGRSGPEDQRAIEARPDVLVFTTAGLIDPLTVIGRVTVHLWIRPDTPDLDLAVRLSDVYPSGHSMLVMDGIQRARMRCADDSECFLTPGTATEIVVDLWSTAIVFNRGHRLRLSVSGSNSPRFEVNPNHGGDLDGDKPGVVARPQLLFGPDHPSRLELPLPVAEPRRTGGRLDPAPGT